MGVGGLGKRKRIFPWKLKRRKDMRMCRKSWVILLCWVVMMWPSGLVWGGEQGACPYRISNEEAARILKVAPDDLAFRAYPKGVSPDDQKKKTYKIPPCSYRFRSKSNFLKSISYVVYVFRRSEKAHSVFQTMRNNFSTVAKVEAVESLGDEAFWVRDDRFHRLIAVRKNVMFDVVSPKDRRLQGQIIRILLKK